MIHPSLTTHRDRRHRRQGAAAVEMAVILPLLMLLALGCVDFGRFLYHYIALNNAAQAGASHGAMNPYSVGAEDIWKANIQTTARNEMFQQTGYVETELVTVTTPTVEAAGLRRVRVVAEYPFKTLVNWPGIPHEMTLRSAVEVRAIR